MASIYLRNQVTRFVILFVERSGSTYLATLLDAHPQILAKREEFAHLRQRGKNGADQLDWARQFYTPPLVSQHKAVGFKTKMVDIIDPDGFARLLHDLHCRIIVLQRRNIVKAAVSTINAKRLHEASGNWNLLNDSDRLPAFPVDLDEFDRLLRERQAWDREIEEFTQRLHLPSLQLMYEDLLVSESAFMQRVFDFIGVRYEPVTGKTLKNTRDDLRDAIVNFDELRNHYLGTRYEQMFDEVLV
jgi:LPS sulfotransferase NodH